MHDGKNFKGPDDAGKEKMRITSVSSSERNRILFLRALIIGGGLIPLADAAPNNHPHSLARTGDSIATPTSQSDLSLSTFNPAILHDSQGPYHHTDTLSHIIVTDSTPQLPASEAEASESLTSEESYGLHAKQRDIRSNREELSSTQKDDCRKIVQFIMKLPEESMSRLYEYSEMLKKTVDIICEDREARAMYRFAYQEAQKQQNTYKSDQLGKRSLEKPSSDNNTTSEPSGLQNPSPDSPSLQPPSLQEQIDQLQNTTSGLEKNVTSLQGIAENFLPQLSGDILQNTNDIADIKNTQARHNKWLWVSTFVSPALAAAFAVCISYRIVRKEVKKHQDQYQQLNARLHSIENPQEAPPPYPPNQNANPSLVPENNNAIPLGQIPHPPAPQA